MNMNGIPRLQSEIEIVPLDTSSTSKKHLVKIGGGRQFEISNSLTQLLYLIDGKRSINEIAEMFSKEIGKGCSPSDVKKMIETHLIPYGIIVAEDRTEERPKQQSYLYLKIPFFSQRILRPITGVLERLFARFFFVLAVVSAIVFHLYFYIFAEKPAVSVSSVTGLDIILVYALVFLSTLFHELGHSSACHHFGARHGDIGLGLYLYFPVFYADVSDVWQLKRTERAIVDFGGVYFQLLLVPILYIAYVFSHSLFFLYTIYALDFSIVTSLNPLLRFDGYWLASDLAGVPNLRKRSQETIKYFFRRLLRPNSTELPPTLEIRRKAKYFLYGYALVSNFFFAFFFYNILIFLPQLISTYPAAMKEFLFALPRDLVLFDFANIFRRISVVFFPNLVLVTLTLMLARLFMRVISFFRKRAKTLSSQN